MNLIRNIREFDRSTISMLLVVLAGIFLIYIVPKKLRDLVFHSEKDVELKDPPKKLLLTNLFLLAFWLAAAVSVTFTPVNLATIPMIIGIVFVTFFFKKIWKSYKYKAIYIYLTMICAFAIGVTVNSFVGW